MKLLLKLGIVLILLFVALVVAAVFYIDAIAKGAVEHGATYALGVDTSLDKADVGIMSGEFGMEGLNVSNPDGYDSPHFMSLNSGGVAVSFASLREDVVELPTLTLSGLDMHLQKEKGKANYNVILDNLKKFELADEEPVKKFVIRTVKIENVNVHVDLVPEAGDVMKVNVPIDLIELSDVGSGGESVSIGKLVDIILKAVIGAVIDKAGSIIPDDILGELEGGLAELASLGDMGIDVAAQLGEGALDVLGDAANVAGDAVGDVAGGVGEALGDVADGLGGLLGGDKDDDDDGGGE